jgi:hypothetical protein
LTPPIIGAPPNNEQIDINEVLYYDVNTKNHQKPKLFNIFQQTP